MAKHTSKEAYFERLRNLAEVNKPSIKESKSRNLGSLIDYKRAADGVAYGIIKENHSYYLKKAGIKQDPNVADFAYIGGMENITGFQYKSLAEADKQRNMIFHTITEATAMKPDKNGGNKKKRLHEDVASDEIDQAASKIGDLDAATDAEQAPPAEPPAPEGGDEMSAGLDAKPMEPPVDGGEGGPPPEGGEEGLPPAGGEEGMPPEGGEEGLPPAGGEEGMPPEGGETGPPPEGSEEGGDAIAPEGGEEGMPPEGEEGGEPPVDGGEGGDGEAGPPVDGGEGGDVDEPNRELEKAIGKITNTIRKTEMEDPQVKSYINSFLAAFKDKLRDIDIEDRKEMANKLLKVVGQEEIDDLGDSISQDEPEEGGIEEEQCVECGGLPEYAKSRGYDSAQSFMECDDEEKASVVSGYANAHNDGMNDGDFKTVAIVITPEILDKLKGDYGHEEYAEKLTPYTDSMNEASEEDKMAQLNELWGGLGKAFGKVGGDIGGGLKKAGQAVGGAVQKGAQAIGGAAKAGAEKVGQYATGVKQAYHTGEIPGEVKKLEAVAADLGKQIAALNTRLTKAGKQPVNIKSILTTIQNQLGSGGQANLNKYGNVAENTDPANTVVSVPNMLKEDDETDEPETKDNEFDVQNIKTDGDEIGGIEGEETKGIEGDEIEPDNDVDDTKDGISFAPAAQSLGVATVKPDGAATTGVDITIDPDKTVNISMNEAKRKLIKQIAEGVNNYMDEVSTGYAMKAGDAAYPKQFNTDTNPIGATKAVGQTNKFAKYINPELIKYVQGQGFKLEKRENNKTILNIPTDDGSANIGRIEITPAKYSFIYGDATKLPLNTVSKLPNIIKRIQADMKGEKSRFNPAMAPAQGEPVGEPTFGGESPMNESEQKVRKYVRARLEEKAGLRKPRLNESKKSTVLKKLDAIIDEQFKLYESVMKKKKK